MFTRRFNYFSNNNNYINGGMESPGAAGAHQQFCLKWNSFGSNLAASFAHLFRSETLADVTLFCDGVSFRAHKLILAACSKHLADLFETAAPLLHQNHLLVILDGTSAANMAALLEFMYKGEVHVSQDSLSSFLKAAECLQVKGLSIEHEKLAVAQSHNNVMEPNGAPPSPSSRSSANTPLPTNKPIKMEADMPPQSPTYSCPPGASIAQYMHHYSRQYEQQHHQAQQQHQQQQQQQQQAAAQQQQQQQQQQAAAQQQHQQAAQQQAVAQHNQAQQRRNMRSPTMQERPSVLRDCSKTVGSSRPASPGPGPMSLAYRPSSSASSIPSSDAEVAADSSRFDPDQAPTSLVCPPDSAERRTQDPGCPEDLRMKMEPPSMMVAEPPSSTASSNNLTNSVASNGSLGSSMSSIYDMDEKSKKDRTDLIPTTLWNSVTSKLSKTGAITTPDGKKLKCPFCERLYGYETNLRAHIRQRHQGIRVPCPFCSRTFTRNNTVRRHIAREHKTELSLKAFQQVHTP